MSAQPLVPSRRWIGSVTLVGAVLGIGILLAAWKRSATHEAEAASAHQPEPVELVTLATAEPRQHRQSTTAVGTVLALRSITLRNELAGTVRRVSLNPGEIVEPGTVLVALDVAVEEAELQAQEAEAGLAETTLARLERLRQHQATRPGPGGMWRWPRSRAPGRSSPGRRYERRSAPGWGSPMSIPVST